MRVYVACSSHVRWEAEVDMAFHVVKGAGHELTCDWLSEKKRGLQSPRQAAQMCLEGLDAAEAMIFLVTPMVSAGAWFEAGYMLRSGKPVFAVPIGPTTFRENPCEWESLIFLFQNGVAICNGLKAAMGELNRLTG